MSWQPVLFWGSLISGAAAIWLGTYRPKNRRCRGVLPPPSHACERNKTECV
jgi:hypothetical protein